MTGIIKRLFSKKSKNKQPSSSKEKSEKSFSKTSSSEETYPNACKVLNRDSHTVSRSKISKNAVKVLYKLNEAGYEAYLVGGGVRDILLGLRPKDFDVATNATPEQIHSLFRNSRLIGRRFRLAHILFGREVIEVATFRANHDEEQSGEAQSKSAHGPSRRGNKKPIERSATSDHGMLMRDNVYGTMTDDAYRRDFTVNALYYTVRNFSVIDYTNGLQDLADRKLRLIGDPNERYREDPVRILRAIRLSCKLNLTIETKTAAPIKELANLLEHVSSARLWDESSKLLLAGYAEKTWKDLRERNVAEYLFTPTINTLNRIKKSDPQAYENFNSFITSALRNTDKRIAAEQPVTPAFLFAVFLWQPVLEETDKLLDKGLPPYEAHQKAASRVMEMQRQTISIPKRFSTTAKEMWALQFRLNNLRKKNVDSVISHQRFRAAYDFLCLRAGDDPELNKLATWWTDYQEADLAGRQKMINGTGQKATRRKSRSKTKK